MEHLSLFKVGRKGIWYIQYHTDDGIRKQKSTGCKIKADAVKVLADFKRFLAEDRRARKHMLLSAFKNEFHTFARTNYSAHTTYLYDRMFDHLLRICGDQPLTKFTAKHYDQYKVTRLREPVQGKIPKKVVKKRRMSPITVNMELRSLRAAFNTALRWQLIEKNPFEGMSQIPIPKTTPAFLTAADVQRLLNAIQRPWLKDVIIFAVNTGMRRGELLSLRWCDIDRRGAPQGSPIALILLLRAVKNGSSSSMKQLLGLSIAVNIHPVTNTFSLVKMG